MNEKIYAFVNDVFHTHRLAGIAIGVVNNSQPVFQGGFGVRSLQSGEPVTSRSLFHLASVSKLFVATAIMQLVERGMLTLYDSPMQHLPYLRITNPYQGYPTLKNLLSHTSGFTDETDYHWDQPEHDEQALERYVRSLDIDFLYPPGQRFFYSNIAYEVLGDVIAKVSHQPFEQFIKMNILDPLGMSSSTHFFDHVPPELAVAPHVALLTLEESKIYPYHRAHAPSSTLHSNVEEMNRWALAMLHQKSPPLAASSYTTIWQPRMTVANPDRLKKSVGLGWFLDERHDLKLLFHSGQDVGFSTYFLLAPEKSIGITVLCNTSPAPVEKIAWGILDILLDSEPNPIKPPIMVPLGAMYQEKGLDAMRMQYRKIKTAFPDDFDYDVNRIFDVVSCLLDSNLNSDALALITFGLELCQENAGGYELLARAHFQMGNVQEALIYAQRSLEIEPDNAFLRQQINALLREG